MALNWIRRFEFVCSRWIIKKVAVWQEGRWLFNARNCAGGYHIWIVVQFQAQEFVAVSQLVCSALCKLAEMSLKWEVPCSWWRRRSICHMLNIKNPCQEGRSCQRILDRKTAAAVDFLQQLYVLGVALQPRLSRMFVHCSVAILLFFWARYSYQTRSSVLGVAVGAVFSCRSQHSVTDGVSVGAGFLWACASNPWARALAVRHYSHRKQSNSMIQQSLDFLLKA